MRRYKPRLASAFAVIRVFASNIKHAPAVYICMYICISMSKLYETSSARARFHVSQQLNTTQRKDTALERVSALEMNERTG